MIPSANLPWLARTILTILPPYAYLVPPTDNASNVKRRSCFLLPSFMPRSHRLHIIKHRELSVMRKTVVRENTFWLNLVEQLCLSYRLPA
jgi:hypothetical protein